MIKFVVMLLNLKLITSSNIQEVKCLMDLNECFIDGSFLGNSTALLNITGPKLNYYELHLSNFEYLQTSQFAESIKATELKIENSIIDINSNLERIDSKVRSINIKNCSLSIDSLKNFKNLQDLKIKKVKINEISPTAFAGLNNVSYFELNDANLTQGLILSLKHLESVSIFSFTKCGITNKIFSEVLQNLKSPESLSFTLNSIKSIKCDKVSRFEMFSLSINLNQLFGIFPTCGVPIVDVSENKIDTLFIQSGTTTVNASMNVISDIRCDKFVNLLFLNVAGNLLTDLMCVAGISTLEDLNINSNKFKVFGSLSFNKMTSLKAISALDNPIKFISPSLFASVTESLIMKISVDRFDAGYDKLTTFYPHLYEVTHNEINGTCDDYGKVVEALKSQNISLFLLKSSACN